MTRPDLKDEETADAETFLRVAGLEGRLEPSEAPDVRLVTATETIGLEIVRSIESPMRELEIEAERLLARPIVEALKRRRVRADVRVWPSGSWKHGGEPGPSAGTARRRSIDELADAIRHALGADDSVDAPRLLHLDGIEAPRVRGFREVGILPATGDSPRVTIAHRSEWPFGAEGRLRALIEPKELKLERYRSNGVQSCWLLIVTADSFTWGLRRTDVAARVVESAFDGVAVMSRGDELEAPWVEWIKAPRGSSGAVPLALRPRTDA